MKPVRSTVGSKPLDVINGLDELIQVAASDIMKAEGVAGAWAACGPPALLSQCRAFWKMVFAPVDGRIPLLVTLSLRVLVSGSVRTRTPPRENAEGLACFRSAHTESERYTSTQMNEM